MKRLTFTVLAIASTLTLSAQQVVEDNYTQLIIQYDLPDVAFDKADLCGETFIHPAIEGYMLGGEYGSPAVPFISSLLTVPFCDGFEVSVANAAYDTVDLPPLDVMPQQPPRRKSDTTKAVLMRNKEVYTTDAYSGLPLAEVIPAGVARDRRLAHLRFAPVSINPVSHKAVICRKATVTVRYINPDRKATVRHYERYHTPAFDAGQSLNSLGFSSKSGDSPIRLVIVSPARFDCRRLQAFADWKRRQGMLVDIYTSERTGSGARNELAEQLQSLYDEATADAPAPTFVIIIGDHDQLPAFNSKMPSNSVTNYYGMLNHITDLYYASWTSDDNLPDAYYGRLSATDTVSLARIINKIMLYESYSFEDDSYLGRAVLVSGIDAGNQYDNAYHYSDPTMDYAASQYITSTNGYQEIRYYKNRTSYAPTGVSVTGSSSASGIADTLRNLYNRGYGWINYSAHGDWNSWSIPLFSVNNANNMSNSGMPSIMIGNCCLSNKFNKDECLGEALLRRADNAGAAAYVGASQETYWTHDFYWAVGLRGESEFNGNKAPSYSATRLGMYDHLFHTHNEPFSQHGSTMGSIVYYGNMAVQGYTGDDAAYLFSHYYWEIYHLMGDPSMMPWLGKAKDMPFSADTTDAEVLKFTSVANAYVAVVDSATLQVAGATYCDAHGFGQISLPQSISDSKYFISASAQGYKPYISNIDGIDLGLNLAVRAYPNPASTVVNIIGSGIREVSVATPNGSVIDTYTVGSDTYTLDVSHLQPGLYLIIVSSDDGTSAHRLVRI